MPSQSRQQESKLASTGDKKSTPHDGASAHETALSFPAVVTAPHPSRTSPEALMRLQRVAGNTAVRRMVEGDTDHHRSSSGDTSVVAVAASLAGSTLQRNGEPTLSLTEEPRALSQSVDPSGLTDTQIAHELDLIERWLAAHEESSTDRDAVLDGQHRFAEEKRRRSALVKHTSGKDVDTYVSTSKFFKGYVGAAMKRGVTAEAAVQIHRAAAFKQEWIAYALVRTNPDTGSTFTKAEAEAWEPDVNAFAAPGKIHIHEERGEAGTAIHESMHLFTHADFAKKYGFNVNEGSTEVFTRKLCAEQSVTRGTFYPSQRKSVDKLVSLTSEKALAEAYFDGKYDELKAAVDKAKKAGTFDAWIGHMKKGKYTDADALL